MGNILGRGGSHAWGCLCGELVLESSGQCEGIDQRNRKTGPRRPLARTALPYPRAPGRRVETRNFKTISLATGSLSRPGWGWGGSPASGAGVSGVRADPLLLRRRIRSTTLHAHLSALLGGPRKSRKGCIRGGGASPTCKTACAVFSGKSTLQIARNSQDRGTQNQAGVLSGRGRRVSGPWSQPWMGHLPRGDRMETGSAPLRGGGGMHSGPLPAEPHRQH